MTPFWLIMTAMITQNPYSVKSVGDDSIIVDADCFEITKTSLEMDLQRSFTSIKQIVLLPPLVIEPISLVDSAEYPYVNTVKLPVHIARAHVKQDSKSSETYSFNYFHKRFHNTGGFLGENPPFVCILHHNII